MSAARAATSTVCAVLAGVLLVACDAPTPTPLLRAETALQGLDGSRATLADWRGKTLVLNVWASWCEPCRAEMASLDALNRALDPQRGVVIGLTVDADRNLAREYLLRQRVGFANFSDAESALARQTFGVASLPQTLIIDADGRLRERVVGARDWSDAALAAALRLPTRTAAVQTGNPGNDR